MREISFGENGNLWLENKLAKLRFNKIINSLKAVKPLEEIIDLGAGFNGLMLTKILKLFPGIKNAVGVDLSVAEKAVHPKVKLIAANLNNKLPFADNSFDAVICTAVIEHLDNCELALSETRRILKNGGCLILTSPSPRAKIILEFLSLKLGWLDKTEIEDHKNYFTGEELSSLLNRLGFKEIKIKVFQLGFNILISCKK